MIEYKLFHGKVIKDGHTMFMQDVVTDLTRLSVLEEQRNQIIALRQNLDILNDKDIRGMMDIIIIDSSFKKRS